MRHPEIEVELIGRDGNAYGILGAVKKALSRAGVSAAEQSEYFDEATSGDYDHLLGVTMEWVTVI